MSHRMLKEREIVMKLSCLARVMGHTARKLSGDIKAAACVHNIVGSTFLDNMERC